MKISGGFDPGNQAVLIICYISNNYRYSLEIPCGIAEDLKFDKQIFNCDEKTRMHHFRL
jgi:hypothetical protein